MRHKTRACALAQALTKARARDLLFPCRQTEVVRLLEGAKDEKLAAVVLALLTSVEDIAEAFRRTSQVHVV
jgi:hypothetical protein